jgi:hypothetical protein
MLYEKRISTADMKCLCGVAGYKCADQQHNTDINEKLNTLCPNTNLQK